jgi:polyribonucleotide 5'-hydroxyl-kinase
MNAYLNAAHIIDNQRKLARDVKAGPVVAVIGPSSCGKTSLVKILINYAIRSGWNPLLVETDVRHGMITVPGALSAVQVSLFIASSFLGDLLGEAGAL